MSLMGHRSRLTAATRELMLKWHDTRNYWRDAKAEEFQRRFLQDLGTQVDKTVGVIEKLDQLLVKVRKDCE